MARQRARRRAGGPFCGAAKTARDAMPDQRGVSLVWALVILMLCALLLPPLLMTVRTATHVSNTYHATLQEQYATDAAIEYMIARMLTNPGYRGWVRSYSPVGVTTQLPEQVNGLRPQIRVAVVSRLFDYTVWGDSQVCSPSLDWTGAKGQLIGNAHSNAGLKISGVTVVGVIEYVGSAMVNHNTVEFTNTVSNPVQVEPWTMMEQLFVASDYTDPTAEGTPAHEASPDHYYHHTGDYRVRSNQVIPTGIHYVEGKLHINGNNITGTATFVVDGVIEVNGSGIDITPYVDGLVFYSTHTYPQNTRCNKWVIKIVGSDHDVLDGWIYAPGGQIEIRGSGSVAGAFVGDSVVISGSGLRVEPAPSLVGQQEYCETIDIMAWTGETRTSARCRICYDTGEVEILSWAIETTSQ